MGEKYLPRKKMKVKRPRNLPAAWPQLSYGNEARTPILAIEPLAGSWPTFFLKKDKEGSFLSPNGEPICFEIAQPSNLHFEQELTVVRDALENLTPHQEEIARYWGEGPATKQWSPIIDKLIDTYSAPDAPQENPVRAARILAAVQAGIHDAFVVTWFFKYLWNIPRPIQLDQSLKPVLVTPKFPAYPSGHAVISGTAEVILSYFFPPEAEKLKELAEENAISRIYAGVHFPSDGEQGLRLGRHIGRMIVTTLHHQCDSDQVRIDPPITKFLDADLQPPPYKQAIPFPRNGPSASKQPLPENCILLFEDDESDDEDE